jgi:hypothetical protein
MNILFHAHSGLRYLVLLAGLIALGWFAYGLATKRPVDRSVRILGSSFVGLLDTQVLLGVLLLTTWPYYPALIGHIVMMVLAAGLAHALLVVNRRRANPGYLLPLIAVAGALVLILGGILAIGRPILGSAGMGG